MLISIESELKATHPINLQIGLKGMEAPGRWNVAKSGIWFMPLYDPLYTPEKISEFLQGERIAGILPDRSSDSMAERSSNGGVDISAGFGAK